MSTTTQEATFPSVIEQNGGIIVKGGKPPKPETDPGVST